MNGHRLAIALVTGSLLLGVAVGAISYLGSSLVIGPAWRADTQELHERGAQVYFESCAGFSEPRFWPECSGDARENRARGAEALVVFCTEHVPNRFFGADDCLRSDRPPLALVAGPGLGDLAAGGIAAAVALVGLALMALGARLIQPPRGSGQEPTLGS
jgi:hypothetical protein